MAETTRPLITDDAEALAAIRLGYEAWGDIEPVRTDEELAGCVAVALDPRLRVLRARWVAEALEELARQAGEHVAWLTARVQDQADRARIVGAREVLEMAQRSAAEYRAGAR